MDTAKKLKIALNEHKSVQDMYSILSSNSSKSISSKMKWVSAVLGKMGIQKLQDLLGQRRIEKKQEENLSLEEQANNSIQFITVFGNELEIIFSNLGIQREQKEQKDLFNSENYLKIIKCLLQKLEKSNMPAYNGSNSRSVAATASGNGNRISSPNRVAAHSAEKNAIRTKVVDDIPKEIGKIGQIQKLNQLEFEIQEIKKECTGVVKKYSQLESLYKEALEWSGKDVGKKQIFLLKSQNIQLERFSNDLVKELNSKEGFVHQVDEDLYKIRDILARVVGLLSLGKAEKIQEGLRELKLTCQYLEALQKQIHRKLKDHTRESREEDKTPDFEFLSEFISTPKHSQKVSLADICSGSISHLNLKHVSRLESQLHGLYDCLLQLFNSIDSCIIPNIHPQISDHQKKIIEKTNEELSDSINSLISLSVLVPAAPYPKLDTIRSVGYPALPTKEDLISKLPPCSASVKTKFGEFWDNLLHGLNSFIDHKESEVVAIAKELDFHKSVYRQYNQKIGNVVEGLEKKKSMLDSDFLGVISPLEEIRKNIASLEFNPVKVGEFLASTDDKIAKVLAHLHKKDL